MIASPGRASDGSKRQAVSVHLFARANTLMLCLLAAFIAGAVLFFDLSVPLVDRI
jgi:hypothetical protein